MARLPDITYSGVPDEVAPAAQGVARASQGLSDTLSAGLQQVGQELVKTQTGDAYLAAKTQLDALHNELSDRKAIPQAELQKRLGDDYQRLPEEIRNQPQQPVMAPKMDASGQPVRDQLGNPVQEAVTDPATGRPQMQAGDVPMWQVRDALYHKEALAAIDQSASHITLGEGWQNSFKRAAYGDVIARGQALHEASAREALQYTADSRMRQIMASAYAGDFHMAGTLIDGSSPVFGADGQTKLRMQVLGIQQTKPVQDALQAFYSDPNSPSANASLRAAQVHASTDSEMTAVDPAHRTSLQRRLEIALDKSDRLTQANGVKDRARAAVDQAMAESAGDPVKANVALGKITDTAVSDEAQKRLRETLQQQDAIRKQVEAPAIGRIEVGIDQRGTLDRRGQDYIMLSPEGQARVEAKLQANKRTRAAEGSAERREQNDADRTALFDFQSLPPKGEQGADQLTTDLAEKFPGVSEKGLARLRLQQARAAAAYQKDLGVGRLAIKDQATNVSQRLQFQPSAAKQFQSYMLDQYDAWNEANPTKRAPTPADVKKMFDDAIQYGETPGSLWGTNQDYAYRLRMRGKSVTPLAPGTQPDKVRNALQAVPEGEATAAPAVPRAAPAPPAAPGTPAGWIPYRNAKTGEVRYNAPGKAKGDWKEAS